MFAFRIYPWESFKSFDIFFRLRGNGKIFLLLFFTTATCMNGSLLLLLCSALTLASLPKQIFYSRDAEQSPGLRRKATRDQEEVTIRMWRVRERRKQRDRERKRGEVNDRKKADQEKVRETANCKGASE